MKYFCFAATCGLCLATLVQSAPLKANDKVDTVLTRRQYGIEQQQAIQSQANPDPVGATNEVLEMPNLGDVDASTFAKESNGLLVSNYGDSSQVPWFDNGDFPFTDTVSVDGSSDGWTSIPTSFEGFKMNTDLVISDGDTRIVQPYYITSDFNATNVKRAILALPGQPRDSWKYSNLFNNALNWVYNQSLYGIQEGEVIIVAPIVLNTNDQAAGATGGDGSDWAVYGGSNWEFGGSTQAPAADSSVSFYTALDKMIDMLLDKSVYPNLEKVVVGGHSMGGQAVQRYALFRHGQDNDGDVLYWIGNPGSFTWLTADRPTGGDCDGSTNKFPYGLDADSNFPKYVRSMLHGGETTGDMVNRFRSRQIHYAFGLLDNGSGDTHCESYTQGANHLQRGANFVEMLSKQDGGFPPTQAVSYVAGVSHQDYPMIAATESLDFIFGNGF